MAMGNPGWKPGVSGNPNGGNIKMKKFLAALERAIAQDDSKRLRDAVEKVLDLAAAGEEWAVHFLADRLDGKPTQQLDMRVTRPTKELSDDELADIAAGSSAGTSAAPASEEAPTQLH
jgi:hypothetical protein